MPKRTNPFQQLAAIIHSRLGSGWNVTESLFLTDSITGEMREVDVVAKATVGTYDIYISVECRDHKRSADVTWIESMAKKHESLSTSKLVLWSRSGFTKAAIAKATALKIDTVSQASAASADWATLARSLIGGLVQLVTPRFSPFIDITATEGTPARLEDVSNALIYDSGGQVVNSIPSIIEFMGKSSDMGKTLLDHAPIGSGDFYAEIQPPVPWFTDTAYGQRVPVLRIGIGISTFVEKLALDAASAAIDGKVATLATASTATGQFQIYVEEAPDGSKQVQAANVRKT
ncbi:hypothetical protein [Sulfuricella sp.]|uniref:hypothetical protein n=1 Tax=Sulfuricella sp. TaxID=2099377 RepID=UPI002BD5DD37|nr:hypothetical protein [Sulfuricella sp.]HUX63012.1 hypothetical protein [Sulfuricella sp.]